MNMVRSLGWIGARTRHCPRVGSLVLVLLCVGMAGAQVVTVSDTMDYRDNVWDDEAGVWFMVPNDIDDHTPWYRTSNQDWGWWHNVSALVPSNATGIESATLTINAWDVNHDGGEDDYIYVNSHLVGTLTGVYRAWQTCTFNLPATVLADLWRDKRAYVFMDIDKMVSLSGGFRVTLGYSTLTVRYTTSGGSTDPGGSSGGKDPGGSGGSTDPGGSGGSTDPGSSGGKIDPGTPPVAGAIPVYRFWSPVFSGHFYVTDETERDWLISTYPDVWTYETVAYWALPSQGSTTARRVYRLWSEVHASHFYTIDDAELRWLVEQYSGVWTYETVAFYAFAPGTQPSGTVPVYRFWSPVYGHHFYTTSEQEKQMLISEYANYWTYETIAWYAYAP